MPAPSLAEHVGAQDRLRDALVLHLRGVLEAAVDDGAQELLGSAQVRAYDDRAQR